MVRLRPIPEVSRNVLASKRPSSAAAASPSATSARRRTAPGWKKRFGATLTRSPAPRRPAEEEREEASVHADHAGELGEDGRLHRVLAEVGRDLAPQRRVSRRQPRLVLGNAEMPALPDEASVPHEAADRRCRDLPRPPRPSARKLGRLRAGPLRGLLVYPSHRREHPLEKRVPVAARESGLPPAREGDRLHPGPCSRSASASSGRRFQASAKWSRSTPLTLVASRSAKGRGPERPRRTRAKRQFARAAPAPGSRPPGRGLPRRRRCAGRTGRGG